MSHIVTIATQLRDPVAAGAANKPSSTSSFKCMQ